MGEEFNPTWEVTVDSTCELSLSGVPGGSWLEWDVWGSVMDDREGGHPEVVAEPWHEPEFDEASPASVIDEGREGNEGKCSDCSEGDDDSGFLSVAVLVEVKVPGGPVTDGGPQFERTSQESLVNSSGGGVPFSHFFLSDWVPGGVFF